MTAIVFICPCGHKDYQGPVNGKVYCPKCIGPNGKAGVWVEDWTGAIEYLITQGVN